MTALELPDHLPRVQIPHLDTPIITPTDQSPTLTIKRQGPDQRIMARQGLDALARARFPDLDLTIIRTRDDRVVFEFDARKTAIVAFERAHVFACRDVPEHHLAVPRCAHDFVVLQPERVHGAFMSAEGPVESKGFPVPDEDLGIFRATYKGKGEGLKAGPLVNVSLIQVYV